MLLGKKKDHAIIKLYALAERCGRKGIRRAK
jgi:hypothetical protein